MKFRSRFEERIAQDLQRRKVRFSYECPNSVLVYKYVKKYLPDFKILANGVLIEAKGVLTPDDRRKLKAVKAQHPEIDIRILFQRASNKLNKKSNTTYGQWADRNGFTWAEGDSIPEEWFK